MGFLSLRSLPSASSLRIPWVYGASIRSCRPCPLREQCQWQGCVTKKPRQVSVLLHPLAAGNAPLLWNDWSRRFYRRACMQQVCHQRVEVQVERDCSASPEPAPAPLSRAPRAHARLSWQERLARNRRAPNTSRVNIKLYGIPRAFVRWLGCRASE